MGRNKAFLKVGDRLIIENTVGQLRPVVQEIIVVTNEPERYRYLGVTVTTDIIPGRGPLSGMHAGLTLTPCPYSVVVACDMPFINGGLARELMALAPGYDVVIPRMGNHLQPLFAVYAKRCLPLIEECLRQDIRKIIAFFPKVRVRYVEQADLAVWGDLERLFCNVNTPQDLDLAARMREESNWD